MFLSFEGIDGCGKTTQLRRLSGVLEERGIKVVQTREPGGTLVAERIREMLLSGRDSLDVRAELLLFGAARAQHVAQIIRPALEKGYWVLSDRFSDSSEAYQGALGLDTSFIRVMNAFVTGNLMPSQTFLLDVAPAIGLERRKNESEDRIEARGLEFQSQVRTAYLQIAARENERFRIIDGAQSPDFVAAQMWSELKIAP